MKNVKNIFPTVKYAFTTIPTYPSGQIGFIVASKAENVDLTTPKREVTSEFNFKYYSADIHKVAFVLPAFASVLL